MTTDTADGVLSPGHMQTDGDYLAAVIERHRIEAGVQPRPVREPAPSPPCDVAQCDQPATLSAATFQRCDRHPPQ